MSESDLVAIPPDETEKNVKDNGCQKMVPKGIQMGPKSQFGVQNGLQDDRVSVRFEVRSKRTPDYAKKWSPGVPIWTLTTNFRIQNGH